jgi:putative ABC transport system permease protein
MVARWTKPPSDRQRTERMQWLRHAARALRRTPVFTIAASLTLVIGIGASIAIFTILNGVLLRPLPYGTSDRLVAVWFDMPGVNLHRTEQTIGTFFTFKRLAKSIEGIAVYEEGAVNVAEPGGGSEPQRVSSAFVSADVIQVLKVSPILGRNFTPDEDLPKGPDVVIISEGLWRSRFGADRTVIGKTMDVNGRSRQIVGVMPARFTFPQPYIQLWMPLQLDPSPVYTNGFNYRSVARLKPGVSVADAQRDFTAALSRTAELYPQLAPGVSMQMVMEQAKPIPVIVPLKGDMTGGIAKTLWMVAAAAGLVLLVACANVTNLILVRADGRQRELAVREALGAGRARVMAHFLAESAVLTAVAGALGVGLAWIAIRLLVRSGPAQIPRLSEVGIDAAAVIFAIVVSALVALVCSVIPALRIGRVHLSNALREGGRGGTAGKTQQRVRGALVAAQIALALVVLSGSGLLLRSFRAMHAVKPGFNPNGVATLWLSLPGARYKNDTLAVAFYAELLRRVNALPGVQSAGIASRIPLVSMGMNQNPFYPEDDPTSWVNKIPPLQVYTTTDGDYFKTMGIPLLAGKTFDRIELQNPREAIISRQTAIAFWKDSTGHAALGKRFKPMPGPAPWWTIVGVVGDTRDSSVAASPKQSVYFPQAVDPDTTFTNARYTMAVVVRTGGNTTAMTAAVQRIVRELDPLLPTFEVRSMVAAVRASMAQLSFTMAILGAAAAVTLLLGAIGLYGVMAYAVTLRTRELGVRIALGAQPRAVAAMMTRQGIALTALGIATGLGIFALVARFIRSFLYGVAASDPLTLAAVVAILIGVAALASWMPARRASRVDPVEALRAE